MFFTISSIIFFFIAIIISQFIADPNLKVAYWLMLFLLYISYANIYMSTYFYIKLRSQPGIQGPRGDQGEPGPDGSDGVCEIIPSCNIANCKGLIEDVLKKNITEYNSIISKKNDNIELNTEDKKILRKVNQYIDTLVPMCEEGSKSKTEFVNYIEKSLK
tara:strand:- start:630 stop:1109 length:480 start_codon:yes stop_codon:yes gene_type:complete